VNALLEISARDRANAEQRAASDPGVSAFVSASAGSGKTKLLTDRLLRLMLGGADPGRIQCLTYTRAAAAEMALRLQSVLGTWVKLPESELETRLRALDVEPTEAAMTQARALFAAVLDLPGGMRIGTIHAFCQSLLRRFPLEAQISPHFRLIEDAAADVARRDAEEQALAPAAPQPPAATRHAALDAARRALEQVAGLSNLRQFDRLVRAMLEDRERLAALLALPQAEVERRQREALCVSGEESDILAAAIAWAAEATLHTALRVIANDGPPGRTAPAATERLEWLAGDATARLAGWAEYADSYFTQNGEKLSWKTLAGERLGKQRPDLRAAMEAEQARITAVREAVRAARCAAVSAALVTLIRPIATAYAQGKQRAIRLDYADLIERTTALLLDPGAAWVLYKLDGGLDHLLLDEVQDTAPAQWRIAARLVEEFFAGDGARAAGRSVFAVGDAKQSIFSFQGADPAAFAAWRARLAAQVRSGGGQWRAVTLDVSFRSTVPVLALVDRVFADPAAAAGVLEPGEILAHHSDRPGQSGAVQLWPLVLPPEKEPPPPWQVPAQLLRAKSAAQLLAETLADWIARQTDGSVPLPSRGRALRPGDVLVLVQTRTDLGRALVRALKHRGVPVAGLDRMQLVEQPAVADLLALCDVLLLPQDDLSLACVLTSPLGGLTDDSLMLLAAPRDGALWDTLLARGDERADWGAARDWLRALFARVDYVPPHSLLGEALGAMGGRARLLARLGPEAAEPIDELLAAALDYAQTEAPSLQGFLHWLRRAAAEVKREAEAEQAESGPGAVRIMTVHGAKGLQAPLVILPDTTRLPTEQSTLLWSDTGGGAVPLWAPLKDFHCDHVERLRADAQAASMAEYRRLLYVALTRAEDRLLICGAAPRKGGAADECWYRLIERGFAGLATERRAFDAWPGEQFRHACRQTADPDCPAAAATQAAPAPLPGWAGAAPEWQAQPPPPEPAMPQRLAPSRPQDAALGAVPARASPLAAGDRDARFRRGKLLHTLLQHLPDVPASERAEAAARFLARPGMLADPAEASRTLADLLAVLDHPALAPLFGPGSRAEVPVTGVVQGSVVGGLVDRLVVLPDRILAADYKTGRLPPERAEEVPVLYLRQMAAYRAVLQAAAPGRPVHCLLVWTTGARVMALPSALLDSHAPAAASG
jgi:ATP-dependent helicase/nuclease subunit A